MPTFAYRAKKGPQESFKGTVEARNRAQAIAVLEQKGLFLITIEEEAPRHNTASKRIRRQDLSVFTRQFANLIESGLTITEGLNILTQQTSNPALKSVISGMEEQIKDGATLSKALSAYPRQFSRFYCSIVNAGEISGALETTLGHLADFGEQEGKNPLGCHLGADLSGINLKRGNYYHLYPAYLCRAPAHLYVYRNRRNPAHSHPDTDKHLQYLKILRMADNPGRL